MNTMDALRISVTEDEVIKAQNVAARLELIFEGIIQLEEISEFPALRARLLSAGRSYIAVGERIVRAAMAKSIEELKTEMKDTNS